MIREEDVKAVVERLRAAPKYRDTHLDTITDVVRQESLRVKNRAELERRSRLRLHRAVAGYLLTARPSGIRQALGAAEFGRPDTREERCLEILRGHASTAERLPDLDQFYQAVFDLTGTPRADQTIVDLACGLNPFTVPWLRRLTSAKYVGYDFNRGYVELANQFFRVAGIGDAEAVHRDVLTDPVPVTADLALFLKTYHCVADRTPAAAARLVVDVPVGRVVVSFPRKGFGGRAATFSQRHITELRELCAARGWSFAMTSLLTEDLTVIGKDRHVQAA